jgi:signal transduction histidine kinase
MDPIDEALRATQQALVTFDAQGGVTYSTALADSLLGIQRQGKAAPVMRSTLKKLDGSTLPALAALTAGDLPALLRVRTPEGIDKTLRVTGSPEQRAWVLCDVSDELARADSNRVLLDIMAHDLRAGLVPVKTYAQMLLTGILGSLNEKQVEALATIDHCVEKQVEKIASVLDMVKCEENRLSLNLEPINLLDLLKKMTDGLQRDIKRRNIRLVCDLDQTVALVEGDMARLLRVMGNLFSLCIRQTPQGGEAGVELRYVNGQARIRLWDTGPGSTLVELGGLFKSCREQSSERIRDGRPPDLDLATVYDIVSRHQGSVRVQTDEGVGTSYMLSFPALLKNRPAAAVPVL